MLGQEGLGLLMPEPPAAGMLGGFESTNTGIPAAMAEHSRYTFTVGHCLFFISLFLIWHSSLYNTGSVSNCWTGSSVDSIVIDL